MTPKYRVVDENGKTIAFEWFTNPDGPGDWRHRYVSEHPDAINSGTCPHPGVRECFTGKVDKKGVEIFEKDYVIRTKLYGGKVKGRVLWHRFGWHCKLLFALDDSPDSQPTLPSSPYPYFETLVGMLGEIEVITEGQTDEKESK